jgi:hypothetical protein
MAVTQEELRELLWYEPETGKFYWLVRTSKAIPGSEAGDVWPTKRSKPYRRIRVRRKSLPASHWAHLYMMGSLPAYEMDHRNGDTLDDRWANLRPATRQQNEANRGARRNSKTGIKGVVFDKAKGKYEARIYRRGVHRYLGGFSSPEEAAAAYDAAAVSFDGEFFRPALGPSHDR